VAKPPINISYIPLIEDTRLDFDVFTNIIPAPINSAYDIVLLGYQYMDSALMLTNGRYIHYKFKIDDVEYNAVYDLLS